MCELYQKTIALTYRRQWSTNWEQYGRNRLRHLLVGTEENHEDVNAGYNSSRDSNRTFLQYNTKEL